MGRNILTRWIPLMFVVSLAFGMAFPNMVNATETDSVHNLNGTYLKKALKEGSENLS